MEQPDTSQPDVSIEKVTGRAVEIMRYQGWLPELNVDLPSEVGEEQNGVPVGAAADSFDTYGGKADGEEKDKQGAAGPTTGQRLRV